MWRKVEVDKRRNEKMSAQWGLDAGEFQCIYIMVL